jgi:hypothetical protein
MEQTCPGNSVFNRVEVGHMIEQRMHEMTADDHLNKPVRWYSFLSI